MVSGLSFRTARSLFPYRPVIFALFLLTLCPGPAFAWKNVGSGSAAVPCTTYYQGSLGYNYTSNTVEFCNGTAWGNLVASGTSSGINLGTSVSATNPSVTGDLTTGLFSAATSTVAIAIAGVQTMTVTSTGVGIGSAVPGAVLDLSQNTGALILPIGPTSAEPSPAVNGMIRYNSTYPDVEAYIGNAWTTLTTGGANAGIDLGTSATATNPSVTGDPTTGLFSPAATTVAVAVGGVEAVRVNSSGYVGIGTTSPAHLFDAEMGGVGPQIVASFGNTDTGAGTSEARIVFNQAGPNYFQGISGAYNYGSPYLSFSVNSSYNLWAEKMRIQSNGNVGIGTTSPGSALTVYSASPASPYSGIALYSGGASNYTAYTVGRTGVDGYFGVAGITGNYIGNAVSGDVVLLASTGKLQLGTGFGNNAGLTVASDGVEIGNQTYTSGTVRNPGMHLYTDDAFGMELNYNNSSWGTAVFGRSSDTVALRFGAYASNATAQNTFSPYMTILNSGNVGIGTAAPGATLEVSGNVLLSQGGNRTISVGAPSIGGGYSLSVLAGNTSGGTVLSPGGNLILEGGTGRGGTIFSNGGSVYIAGGSSVNGSVGNVILAYDPSAGARGNAGIGTTSPNALLDIYGGHLLTSRGGTAPSINSCGTSASVTGTDNSFLLTMGNGALTTCTVTFGQTWTTAPNSCVLFPANATAAATGTTGAYVSGIGTTTLTITGSNLTSAAYYGQCH